VADLIDGYQAGQRDESVCCAPSALGQTAAGRRLRTGAGLLNHLSKTNARRHGVRIRGDAVLAAHTLLIIAEADSEDVLHEFLRPFEAAGTVSVESASTCAQVVAGGGCEGIAWLDLRCRHSILRKPARRLSTPASSYTSPPAQLRDTTYCADGGVVMPNARFYIRNHFQMPNSTRPLGDSKSAAWLSGRSRSTLLSCEPSHPRAPSSRWNAPAMVEPASSRGCRRAVGCWRGEHRRVDRRPADRGARTSRCAARRRNVGVPGTDSGEVEARDGSVHFERSLSIDELTTSGALLAYAMNGEQLLYTTGIRCAWWYQVVRVASVKWLTQIELIDRPFDGHFQIDGTTSTGSRCASCRSELSSSSEGGPAGRAGTSGDPRRRMSGAAPSSRSS